MSGWYSPDRPGYRRATTAVALALVGIATPGAGALLLRGVVWTGVVSLPALAVTSVGTLAIVAAVTLGMSVRRSPDELTRRRGTVALVTVLVAFAVGIPLGLFFAVYGDPSG